MGSLGSLLFVFLFSLASSQPAQAFGDLKLVAADGRGVEFIYSSPGLEISQLSADGELFQALAIGGCSYMEEVGKPQVPVRFVHVGVPLEAEIELSLLGTEDSLVTGLRVSPAPEIRGDSLPFYLYRVDQEFYSRDRVYPPNPVEVVQVGMLRNQRVVRLRLSPCQYNPRKGSLLWHKVLRVRIDFSSSEGGGAPPLERDPFEDIYSSVLLNYEQARSFRRGSTAQGQGLLQDDPWYKISLVEEGLYKLTYSDLEEAGIDPERIDPRTLRLYNGGSGILPYELTAPKPDTIPFHIPIYVHGENDGSFDSEDYLLFYGLSLDGWGKNEVPGASLYYNPYTDTNCYWLTLGGNGGMRMKTRDGSLTHQNPYRPQSFEETAHIEENNYCPAQSGYGWVWDVELTRPSLQQSFSKEYLAQFQGVSEEETSRTVFAVYGADTLPPYIHAVRIWVNEELYSDTVWEDAFWPRDQRVYVYGRGVGLGSDTNSFVVEVYETTNDPSGDLVYLDYFEVVYRKMYEAYSGRLRFSSLGNPADTTYEFSIADLGEGSIVVDVTDPVRPVRILGLVTSDREVRFQDRVDSNRVYYGASDFLSPLEIVASSWQSLREYPGAHYLAVCYDGFAGGLKHLMDWRERHLLSMPNPKVRLVKLSEVYNNFSWGLPDPTAIRDFLKYAYENWDPTPGWCFLVGAGTYDYKNFRGLSYPKNYLPPYSEGEAVVGNFAILSVNKSYDDWFIYLTGDNLPDMSLGRTTVMSPRETRWVADKVIDYEKEDLGVWRNRVMLIADDEFTRDTTEETIHTEQTESLYRGIHQDVDVVKVYLMEYPKVGDYKPGARDDIIRYIDDGVLLGNFLGHGSFRRLTHETVVYNPTDISALSNQGRQPFFYYGSCGVGRFERELDHSIADLMQKSNGRGAIGTLGATRATGPSGNFSLAVALFDQFLGDTAVTIGNAVMAAKLNSSANPLYVLFGDPGTRFSLPKLHVKLEVTPEDTLWGGMRTIVRGKVSPPFDGYAYVSAFDSRRETSHTTPGGRVVNYTLMGSPIFEGMTRVLNGDFSQSFVVPLGLERGDMGRVSCYLWGGSSTAHGAVDSLVCGFDRDTTWADTSGPELLLLVDGKPLVDSSFIPENSHLQGICSDESGINLTSEPGISMSLIIDSDMTNVIPLYRYFTYDFDSYTKGEFSYPLPSLEPERTHTLVVRVSDNLRNVSLDTVVVNLASTEDLELTNVMNYPNPFSDRTWFTFQLNQRARVTVKIYTIRGKLIKTIEEPNCSRGFNKIPRDGWNGLDDGGDPVANGVYLYKTTAKAEQKISGVEAPREMSTGVVEKLVVMR